MDPLVLNDWSRLGGFLRIVFQILHHVVERFFNRGLLIVEDLIELIVIGLRFRWRRLRGSLLFWLIYRYLYCTLREEIDREGGGE